MLSDNVNHILSSLQTKDNGLDILEAFTITRRNSKPIETEMFLLEQLQLLFQKNSFLLQN